MYAIVIDENNRITSRTIPGFAPEGAIEVEEIPDGFICDYRYVDGEYIFDPLPKEEPEASETSGNASDNSDIWEAIAKAIREGVLEIE